MAFDNLRIIRLQAENVKRLVAVDISPKGDVVTIAGKNGHGKTSTLDSILWAMAGGRTIQWKPIRDGEARASIRLELGNAEGLQLIVTRTFTAGEDGEHTTKLDVRTADGMKPKGEQTFLSAMVGALSFDPAAFTRADAKDQVRILKDLIRAADPEADFESIESLRARSFLERTDAGKEVKRLRALAGDVEGEDEALVDTADLMSSIADAGRLAQEHARLEAAQERQDQQLEDEREKVDRMKWRMAALQQEIEEAESVVKGLEETLSKREPIKPLPDVSEAEASIREANAKNDEIRGRNVQRGYRRDAVAAMDQWDHLTRVIEDCDRRVREMIEDADLPVSGLSLTPDFVMLRGVPFDQASDAEQLRASMALGMAANPKLRVLRIRDGSLLDEDALAVIREVAGEMDFQIWLEKVGDGGPEAFILENGMLKK